MCGSFLQVRLINDKITGKPRGYAFVEYQHTRDMKSKNLITVPSLIIFLVLKGPHFFSTFVHADAYKQADGRKVDNRRVLVDVERGRTVPNWRPRRLGGGLGSTRVGGDEVNQKCSGRYSLYCVGGYNQRGS